MINIVHKSCLTKVATWHGNMEENTRLIASKFELLNGEYPKSEDIFGVYCPTCDRSITFQEIKRVVVN